MSRLFLPSWRALTYFGKLATLVGFAESVIREARLDSDHV